MGEGVCPWREHFAAECLLAEGHLLQDTNRKISYIELAERCRPAGGSLAGGCFPSGGTLYGECFPNGGTLSGECFPSGGTLSGKCFPSGGALSGECFPSGGTHSGECFPSGSTLDAADLKSDSNTGCMKVTLYNILYIHYTIIKIFSQSTLNIPPWYIG